MRTRQCSMRSFRLVVALNLSVFCASVICAQSTVSANLPVAPPNLLLLMHQEVPAGRASEADRLLVSLSRACDRLETPSYWINLQSLSNSEESLFFDPFESFDLLEQSRVGWSQFYAAHPDLARMKDQIDEIAGGEHTVFAVRRPDLGYLADSIDLSEARYMRIVEVHLLPGRENDFAEGLKILADAHAKIQADAPWVVYEVKLGVNNPTFFVFTPLLDMAKNDDLLSWEQNIATQEAGPSLDRLTQIARESYATAETTLYEMRPQTSHVSSEFADSDPAFWRHATAVDIRSDRIPSRKPPKKGPLAKPPAQ
jgi:hypothetical protein